MVFSEKEYVHILIESVLWIYIMCKNWIDTSLFVWKITMRKEERGDYRMCCFCQKSVILGSCKLDFYHFYQLL